MKNVVRAVDFGANRAVARRGGAPAVPASLAGELLQPAEDWLPGDVVLDADGFLWIRAHPADIVQGWPWAMNAHVTNPECLPEGGAEEDHPARPLTLLVRDGRPASGIVT